jgi:hypothetical protein
MPGGARIRVSRFAVRLFVTGALAAGCGGSPPPEPPPLAPGTFAFAVFGDGPYRSWENGRFERLIEDVNAADLAWFLHVGDVLWYPCSDDALLGRRRALETIRHPVVYTPGDNEWADCHDAVAGRFDPLERLRFLRRTFFADPRHSLGTPPLALESQSADPAWSEFVENARWRFGRFLFVTLHVVGSRNAEAPFEGRTEAHDAEAARRMAAALAWMDSAFAVAEADSLAGVVLAMHGDPHFDEAPADRGPYRALLERMETHAAAFPGPVLCIHGDTHEFTLDHPFRRPGTGDTLDNFTRLETFGSPDIGWVRVVVDSVAGRLVAFEPRRMPRRLWG